MCPVGLMIESRALDDRNREDRVRRIPRSAPSPHILLGDHLAYVKCSNTLELGEDPESGQDFT
jgi:hypothetical protein